MLTLEIFVYSRIAPHITFVNLKFCRVETIDGTAEAGADYEPMNKLVTFGPKETMKEIYIEIIDNNDWEPDEFFYVKLFYHPEGSTEREVKLGRISIAQVTIIDDDGKVISVSSSSIVEHNCCYIMCYFIYKRAC